MTTTTTSGATAATERPGGPGRDRRGRRRRLDPRLAVLRRGRHLHRRPRLGHAPSRRTPAATPTVKYFGTSDEAYTLFAAGDYDVVSASGDSSMRSVADGDAAADQHRSDRALRRPGAVPEGAGRTTRVDGTVYGVPHGWGANVLQYNTEVVDSGAHELGRGLRSRLAVRRQDRRRTTRRSTSPTRRVYLMATQPDLGIENPYALDEDQFDGRHRPAEGAEAACCREYWSDYVAYEDNFRAGQHRAGHAAGRSSPTRSRPTTRRPRSTPCCRRRARRRGPTTG